MYQFLQQDQLILAYPKELSLFEGDDDVLQLEPGTKALEDAVAMLYDPVGSVYCNTAHDKERKIGELSMLVAKEEYTCKGIGSGLVARAEVRARESGCE